MRKTLSAVLLRACATIACALTPLAIACYASHAAVADTASTTANIAQSIIQPGQSNASLDWTVLREKFAKPASTHRIIKIIHGWPEKSEDQDRLIERLKQQGFGGVVCNVSFQDYLENQALWDSFKRAVNRARQQGMVLWLYDEKGYPSANAGGLVLRDHPEWEAEGLLAVEQDSNAGPVTLKLPPGKPVLATAYPV